MGRKSRTKREGAPRSAASAKPAARKDDGKLFIPPEVNGRIARRVLIFSGIPFALALGSLPLSYWLIKVQHVELPNAAVLLVNLLFFGLSVAGITYGLLSASWEPAQPGSALGIREFQTNSRRLFDALTSEGRRRREEKKAL
jgi:hypothetical protein